MFAATHTTTTLVFLLFQAGALLAGLLMVDSPFAKKAHACMQPLTSLFGGMYLGSLGMIVNPVRPTGRERKTDTPRARERDAKTRRVEL